MCEVSRRQYLLYNFTAIYYTKHNASDTKHKVNCHYIFALLRTYVNRNLMIKINGINLKIVMIYKSPKNETKIIRRRNYILYII